MGFFGKVARAAKKAGRDINRAVHTVSDAVNDPKKAANSVLKDIGIKKDVYAIRDTAVDVAKAGDKLFNKGEIGDTKVFGKGGAVSKGLGQVSAGLADAGKFIDKQVAGNINAALNNPYVQSALAATPMGATINEAGQGLVAGIRAAGKGVTQAAAATKQKNWVTHNGRKYVVDPRHPPGPGKEPVFSTHSVRYV